MNSPALFQAADKAVNSDPKDILKQLTDFYRKLQLMDHWQLLDAYNAMKFIVASAEPESVTHRQATAIVMGIRRIAGDKPINVNRGKSNYAAIIEDEEFK